MLGALFFFFFFLIKGNWDEKKKDKNVDGDKVGGRWTE